MLRAFLVAAYALYVAALLAIPGIALFVGGRISGDRMPMQWGPDGNPTWYAPLAIGIWAPVIFTLCSLTFLVVKLKKDQRDSIELNAFAVIAMATIFISIYYWHMSKALEWSRA